MTDSNSNRKSPQVQIPSLLKSIQEEQARQLAEFTPQNTSLPSDAVQHDISGINSKSKNFDEKIYLFPESYNALRIEIHNEWPNLWAVVSWAMAWKAELFVEQMNAATGLNLQFDTGKVDAICHEYLNALRKARGLSPISK